MFIDKLKRKNQTEAQQQCATKAVKLYFEVQSQISPVAEHQGLAVVEMPEDTDISGPAEEHGPPQSSALQNGTVRVESRRVSQYVEAGYQVRTDSPEWDDLLAKLAAEIKVRHYSRKTLKAYAKWLRSKSAANPSDRSIFRRFLGQ